MVQNKLLFEDLFRFSTGGWLYRSTVHISFKLFNFGIYGVMRNIFCDIIWATDSERLFEYIMSICNQLRNLVEVYHEEHFCKFRVCIKTA